MSVAADPFRLTDRISLFPVLHGSGDYALAARAYLLDGDWDALAVPLPPSMQGPVEEGVHELPHPSVVIQRHYEPAFEGYSEFGSDDEERARRRKPFVAYVGIDPCQPVVACLRTAMQERLPRHYIEREQEDYVPFDTPYADAFALKKASPQRLAATLLPAVERPVLPSQRRRLAYMAQRLRRLERDHSRILTICSFPEWVWLRKAYFDQTPAEPDEDPLVAERFQVDPKQLIFLLGEMPFIAGLYERARREWTDDERLGVDGVKEVLIAARGAYYAEFGKRARKITPQLLRTCLKYIRNLTLLDRRLAPDMYTIVLASQQVFGDSFALHIAETIRTYPYAKETSEATLPWGTDACVLPGGEKRRTFSRLPHSGSQWRSIQLRRRPDKQDEERWTQRWNPFRQCSWPPEDDRIETFRASVFQRALETAGLDLARTEKFTTSVMDGIDIRDTLRHWYENQIYVKVLPPNRGFLDAAVMLFDVPADPRDYPWRSTWFAEHAEESTLAFFASDFRKKPVGPGVCQSFYGGSLFLFPPIAIRDVWTDRTFDFTTTLEERLLAAACHYAKAPHVAVVSEAIPGAGWRKLARRYKKRLIHVPLARFSQSTIEQLRYFHVLNGKEIRSYASRFIRDA
jgi:hypothetical protein